ncbi:23S rRNA (guanosine(2251)-2'-O)-methyltransferase RlmB [Desulfogranum japonicum]|uniref:23S rRNA (guanosine(2251)-2'-O)-methyltransferase RlmB n=1 Tax=Desulfogranum japonicum TaxID=231447 RepID=UPI0003FAAC2C|nr:23S rRNA (guanosine(2251)-2'-O)-methyltransferase RlmB [Desulfogranum japonicum]
MKNNSKKTQYKESKPGHEQVEQSEVIWGIHSVTEALNSNPNGINEIKVQKGKSNARLQHIIDLAREHSVRLRFLDPARFGVGRQCNHQGVVAQLSELPVQSFEDLREFLSRTEADAAPRILALDSIQDPRNLGSILRSALAAGFTHICMTRERSVSITPTVVRTSAGATAHLHIFQAVNMADALTRIKEFGYWVYGAVVDREKSQSIYQVDFAQQVCLVIGSEGKGIRPLVQKQCDQLVTIPMYGDFDSLNASVAAAVVMFEVNRRRLS